jgi:5'-nucleotidase
MPDPEAAALLSKADAVVSGTTDKVEAVAAENITSDETPVGESALGDLLADSERSVMHADAAFITAGSLRADIAKGNVTWGDLYAVQPFSNRVYAVAMTGRQIRGVLEQQWTNPLPPYPLAVSGLTYSYDPVRPAGDRVTAIAIGGVPVNETATYRVAIVSYLLEGGDNYTEFTNATVLEPGPLDVEALSEYISSLPQPVTPTAQNRIAIA